MSLLSYARAIPKTELHVHLEGAIRPATLLDLASRNGVALPPDTIDLLAEGIAFRDFHHFMAIFRAACRSFRTAADFERAAYELGAELAGQDVRHAEVTVSPATHYLNGVPTDAVVRGLAAGRARVLAEFGLELNWIFAIVRWWADADRIGPLADMVTDLAIEAKADGVVALGLAGAEALAPPEPFAPRFDRALAAGLHSVPHAGEHGGPDSIRGALRTLNAGRIAHGARAVEEPALVRDLSARGIPLDMCPLSNVRLGGVERLESHPLPILHRAGIIVTINSDDPAIFGTTLSDDYATLAGPLGLSADEIDALVLNGVRSGFLAPERKDVLEAEVRRDLAALRAVHLPAGGEPDAGGR